ncbi:MAG: TOBE domain-containing protein [Deltaproteobacteria bacterium]|jgi:molybdate transport system regulatory protein|nr:TOBE domain-containing protein [Deltaproteobacteria bacterium]
MSHRTLSSARNQFAGKIAALTKGAVNTEVVLDLDGSAGLAAIITNTSAASLELKVGAQVLALTKASWVILSTDTSLKTSARNQLKGKVKTVKRGAVNAEVVLDGPGGIEIVSIITNDSLDRLALKEGQEVLALIKASHVIIGVR